MPLTSPGNRLREVCQESRGPQISILDGLHFALEFLKTVPCYHLALGLSFWFFCALFFFFACFMKK